MLIVQLIAGIALGMTSGLFIWMFSYGLGLSLLAYATGGAIGFVFSGYYFQGKRRVKMAKSSKKIGQQTGPIA